MPLAFKLALLALLGVGCGFLGHRLGRAIRGTIGDRIFLTYIFQGVPLLPGALLAAFFLSQYRDRVLIQEDQDLLSASALFWASFGLSVVVPYVGTRLALEAASKARARQRERVLPFEHWFALMRANPAVADAFLGNYLRHESRLRTDLLAELRSACTSLESRHASDGLLPVALHKLRREAARLEAFGAGGPQPRLDE